MPSEYRSGGRLSQNMVYCAQDSDGFIWIGTQNGLNRYDGNLPHLQDWTGGSRTMYLFARRRFLRQYLGRHSLFGLQIYNPVASRSAFQSTPPAIP